MYSSYLEEIEDIYILVVLGSWLEEQFDVLVVRLKCIPIITLEGDCTVISDMQY